jgi:hypothetical protein
MKKLLIIALILSLTGCKSENDGNYTPKEEMSKIEQIYKPKTIIKNEYGQMNERGTYELIYNDEISFQVNDDYLVDRFALEFGFPLQLVHYENCHLTGEFRYSYGGDNYVVKLNEIDIGFFYMADSGKDFFQIDVEGNQIRYWLYSKGKAELVINKIWRFVPNE